MSDTTEQHPEENEKNTTPPWVKKRAEKGEVVGGGFIVMRREISTNRLKLNTRKHPNGSVMVIEPFEHPTKEAAMKEAKKLSEKYPMAKFTVFEQVGEA